MKNIGKVIEVFSATKDSSGLPRPIVKYLDILKGHGIKNDKFAGKDEDKSVMVVGKKAYDISKENGINLEFGSFGENILFDFDPHDFKIGTVFKVGDVELEITQACTICNHLAVFGKELPFLVKHHRGLYCRVLNNGKIVKDIQVTTKDN
ncbi:MOSC domain-containing protein [Poseidonibacter ostreae]|jgi:MOSC domain-containing protein YiiM|uniref:MOSC domain-containing protein n=1 Tax=Poseidonibacter ostreae TaxID=2654171 RepID=A0A6L4WSH0_9BACT|nr:MOSC domain-containing protein [Poseidonibacter ostreae]KAB7886285.1 MOSC domain-containing protein [Poseidonibacter ostreae]KAB7888884.1 MOSC domain-containing protein [Poseidonibacter ostreae]KAB7890051.1 MOSC domain-containing protein [Poseidonibacter ostreae]MAC84589.1 MOSC domain-containing protein [Arcobacter sp.]|tara:strand:+ start:1029 stop:1478 length:450 start_codon:yes stop_codon:yes gene_type:complete